MTTTEKDGSNSKPLPSNATVKPIRAAETQSVTEAELGAAFERQRSAFDSNPAPSLQERRANLLKLQRLIEQNRLLFVEAANADFGTRAAFETELSEIVGTISIIRYMRTHSAIVDGAAPAVGFHVVQAGQEPGRAEPTRGCRCRFTVELPASPRIDSSRDRAGRG